MEDALLLIERVKNTIKLGESHFREFKSGVEGPPGNKKPRQVKKICEEIAEALVAFANSDGGELLIGVEDDGEVTGIVHSKDDIVMMLKAHETHTLNNNGSSLPITLSDSINIDGKTILYFSVSKGIETIYQLSDGRCVKRKDKETVPAPFNLIHFERSEVRSREYDRQYVDGAMVNDLVLDQLKTMANNYVRGLSVEKYLQQLGVAEYGANGIRLRMAALLLFAKDINKWHPRSQVRIVQVKGNKLEAGDKYNVIRDEFIQGNIFDLLISAWEKLRNSLTYRTDLGVETKFVQKYIYPDDACREALINALAHRDYGIQNPIEIFIYDERMEIKNPGALLSSIKLEDIKKFKGTHESRNSFVARVLRENNFMREIGEGFRQIYSLMQGADLAEPTLTSDSSSFMITVYNKSEYSEKQQLWLSLFKDYNLSRLQRRIVAAGIDNTQLSTNDILKAMNTSDRTIYDHEVTILRNNRIMKQIISDSAATSQAKNKRIQKKSIKRFKIVLPGQKPSLEAAVLSPADLGIYVGNIEETVTSHDLENIFSEFGKITSITLPPPPHHKSFGFVWFASKESAQKAISTMKSGRRISLKGRNIVVKPITAGLEKKK
jgi:ATP-dependent DNA helicase RecG